MSAGIIAVGILVLIAGIVFMAIKKPSQSVPVSQEPTQEDLELIEHKTKNINYYNYVTGTIRNNSQKTYEFVQVEIGIYSQGSLTGTTSASASNLKPGDLWGFEAPVLEQGAYNYKFIGITGR